MEPPTGNDNQISEPTLELRDKVVRSPTLADAGEKHEPVAITELKKTELPALPRISVRLSESPMLLAKPGLVRMRDSIRSIQAGQFPTPLFRRGNFLEHGRFLEIKDRLLYRDPELAEHITQLWSRLYPILHKQTKRQRIRLDFIDLSICALAVRALDKQIRHKHCNAPFADYAAATRGFLPKLENLRRRARTATIRAIGSEGYKSIHARWQKYGRWLRFCALGCFCDDPLLPHFKRRYTLAIDRVVEIAERELRAERAELPEPKVLRRWATLLVHNVRRGREPGVGIATLVGKPLGTVVIRHDMRRRLIKYRRERTVNEESQSKK